MDVKEMINLIYKMINDEFLYCVILVSLISSDTNYDNESRKENLECLYLFKEALESHCWEESLTDKISEMSEDINSWIIMLKGEIEA